MTGFCERLKDRIPNSLICSLKKKSCEGKYFKGVYRGHKVWDYDGDLAKEKCPEFREEEPI